MTGLLGDFLNQLVNVYFWFELTFSPANLFPDITMLRIYVDVASHLYVNRRPVHTMSIYVIILHVSKQNSSSK